MADQAGLSWAVLDSLYDGVFCVDRQRRIIFWNLAAEQITGIARTEAEGLSCTSQILQHYDQEGRSLCRGTCPLAAAMQDGNPRELQAFLRHKQGHRLPVKIRCSPLRDGQGEITGGIEIFADASPLLSMQQRLAELERLAMADPLTQLANRRFAAINLAHRLEEHRRYGWSSGIFLADIDDFKIINDTCGHQAGDQVLKIVARTMSLCARPFDLIGRWGGEEFIGILPHVDRAGLVQIMERMRRLVEIAHLRSDPDLAQKVTLSLGGTLIRAGDGPESVLARADRMLYASKQAGKNRAAADETE